MLAAIAQGRSQVRKVLDSEDTRSTAAVLRKLGVEVPALSRELAIEGNGLRGLAAPSATLDCGNSGTTARLMMGMVAGHPFEATFDGDDSLRSRPMRRVTGPLQEMGAIVNGGDRLPITIQGGHLKDIDITNDKASAQVKSAVLLAALNGGVTAIVREPVHSRDHTERMLNAMGVELRTVVDHGGIAIELDPVESLRPLDIDVPGDFSSAAFFLARALLGGVTTRIEGVGVNSTRTGFLDIVRRMGGPIHVENRYNTGGEPVATLIAEVAILKATHIEAAEIPHLVDEVPMIAALAARAEGETRITGASELRVKETDRLAAVAKNLRAIGVQAEDVGDDLIIVGTDVPLAGRIHTYGDHRIAMAFGILASLPGAQISIDDEACAAVSFPTFWQQLRSITHE